jgi:hypothetical protein
MWQGGEPSPEVQMWQGGEPTGAFCTSTGVTMRQRQCAGCSTVRALPAAVQAAAQSTFFSSLSSLFGGASPSQQQRPPTQSLTTGLQPCTEQAWKFASDCPRSQSADVMALLERPRSLTGFVWLPPCGRGMGWTGRGGGMLRRERRAILPANGMGAWHGAWRPRADRARAALCCCRCC